MKNRLKIFHVRDEERQMTVAAEVTEDLTKVCLGYSFCNPSDNFNKKIGRTKAIGRMRSRLSGDFIPFSGHSSDDIAEHFNSSDTFVGRIKKPRKWRHGKLTNVEGKGLTFIPEA